MTAAIFLGALFGVGLTLVASGVRPLPVPLDRALAELRRPNPLATAPAPLPDGTTFPASSRLSILGDRLAATPFGQGIVDRAGADLRITATTAADHLTARATSALAALLWAPFTAALMATGGVTVGVVVPLWVSVALAPLGWAYPTLALRTRATDRRRSFRHAFSAFLDIVSISLAGGRGVESALHDAAESGHGWAFEEIRRALLDARLRGDTPWAGLNRLGTDIAVPELCELAASAALAGSEGARVRASLAAKARAMRLRGLADVEAAAQSASERMSLPVVLLMVGFIAFLSYPAIDRVLNGI